MTQRGIKGIQVHEAPVLPVERIHDLLRTRGRLVIGVAGGSATGKSSAISRSLLQWAERQVFGGAPVQGAILALDDFQLGRVFVDQSKSPYRWDDPDNFDIPRVKAALCDIREHGRANVPTFSLAKVARGELQTFVAPQLTILEGLYALYPDLIENIDYGIYVETPLAGRVVRRVFRFLYEHQIDKPLTAISQCLTTVLAAHREKVVPQRLAADSVITLPYSFEETARRFSLSSFPPRPGRRIERRTPLAGDAAILLSSADGGGLFEIEYHAQLVLSIPISEELAAIARTVDWNER